MTTHDSGVLTSNHMFTHDKYSSIGEHYAVGIGNIEPAQRRYNNCQNYIASDGGTQISRHLEVMMQNTRYQMATRSSMGVELSTMLCIYPSIP